MKVALLISGGVDSSVALALLKEQGHEVTAFYLKIWLEDELSYLTDCPWEEDLNFAQSVCEQLDVQLVVVPMQREYHERIVSYTISEVRAGRTPNPDVMCNNQVKFGAFLEFLESNFQSSDKRSFDFTQDDNFKIASGHYAQVIERDGQFLLKQAPDDIKDQTYFLCRLSQKQLAKLIFPIGQLSKGEVRALAVKYDLANKDRKDSQGLCFLGKFKFKDFIAAHLGEKIGDMIEYETGKKLGEHHGYWFHTVGQRKGIELGGGPWYVVKKDIEKNIVYISKKYHEEDKSRDSFEVCDLNWFLDKTPDETALKVKLRHGPNSYNCQIKNSGQNINVKLDQNDQGIAAGQMAVFYSADPHGGGDLCLGGGVIC